MSAADGGVGVGVGVDLLSPFSSSLSWAAAAQQPRRNNSAAALAGVGAVNVNVNVNTSSALASHWTNSALPSTSAVSLLSASASNLDDSYSTSSLHPSSNDFHLYAAFDHQGTGALSSSEQESDPIKAANNFIGAMHNNFEGDFDAAFLTHTLHNHQQAFNDALVDSHGVNSGVADELALANSYAANSTAVHPALSAHALAFPSATQLTRSVSNPNSAVGALNAANTQQRVDEVMSHSHGQLVDNSLDATGAFRSSINGTLSALNGSVDADETLLHLHQEIERSSSFPGSSSQPSANANIWQNFSTNSAANPSLATLEAYFSNMALDKKALGVNGLNAFAENLAAATNVNASHMHTNLNLSASAPLQSSSIAAQLMLQQQQQSQQRAQLHSVLNAATQNVNANSSQSPPPSNPLPNPNNANGNAASGAAPQANGSSSPSNGNPNAVVNLATIAGGLNPVSLLASAESPHALPLLEPLLAVSPLTNLLSLDDMKKSVQLRCVLLELDRAYKEIVHLKQENSHLQKNIDKCIKMMNLQDVDQYVNQLARMRYPGPPPMGNMNERNSKGNYHKSGGGGYNNGGNGSHHPGGHGNSSNYSAENSSSGGSENENDASSGGVHSQHNQYGRRVYYGPNSAGGGNRGRGNNNNNYRGGGGNRGGRYHSNRGE